jgi:dTDP-4-dehydrorhamnose reductase
LGELNDAKNLTLRTSHIGRELTIRKSFIEWLLSQKGGDVEGYGHAIYSGLTSRELARLIRELLTANKGLTGMFHVSSQPISKLDIINKLNELLNLEVNVISDLKVQINRSLNSDKFRLATNLTVNNWDQMLSDFRKDQKNYE